MQKCHSIIMMLSYHHYALIKVCHTDIYTLDGHDPEGEFTMFYLMVTYHIT
jgi:hypothetical protein